MRAQNAGAAAAGPPGPAVAETASVRVERPPPGLARGREAGPPWLILTLGALAALVAIGFYLRKLRRRSKA